MPDYSTGKIYKIINPQNEIIYIGSTIQALSMRFCKHDYKGNGNRIILLENYSCNSKEELVKKEQEVIEQHENLLNKYRAYSSEEYKKEYTKEYYEENKNKMKVKITCECGCKIRKSDLSIHKKSKKHINLMSSCE